MNDSKQLPFGSAVPLLVAATLFLNGSAALAQPAPQPADSSLLRVASALVESTPEIGRVWPGFWPQDQAFLLLRPTETALLVTPRTPPSEYVAASESELPEELEGRAYFRKEYLPEFDENTFSTRYGVGSDTIPALEPRGSTFFGKVDFYAHESFHGYQRANWTETPGDTIRAGFRQPLVDPSHIEPPEFRARGEVERRILDAALDISTEDSLRALMRRYLAIRQMRTKDLEDVQAVERSMERREGTAQYVGCYAAAAAADVPESRAMSCIREELRTPLDSMNNFPETDARLMRWRQYGTGGALALILDRLNVGDWKTRIAEGTALDEVLSEAVGYDAERHADLAQPTFRRFDYAELLQEAKGKE